MVPSPNAMGSTSQIDVTSHFVFHGFRRESSRGWCLPPGATLTPVLGPPRSQGWDPFPAGWERSHVLPPYPWLSLQLPPHTLSPPRISSLRHNPTCPSSLQWPSRVSQPLVTASQLGRTPRDSRCPCRCGTGQDCSRSVLLHLAFF